MIGSLRPFSSASSHHSDQQTDQLIDAAGVYAHQSNEAVKRMNRTADSAEAIAISTLEQLERHSRQIMRAQSDVDQIDNLQAPIARQSRITNSFFGQAAAAVLPSRRSDKDTNESVIKKKDKHEKKAAKKRADEEKKALKNLRNNPPRVSSSSLQSNPELAVLPLAVQDEIRATDEGLEELSERLKRLKNLASVMGTEIEGQNIQLDAIKGSSNKSYSKLQDNLRSIERMNY